MATMNIYKNSNSAISRDASDDGENVYTSSWIYSSSGFITSFSSYPGYWYEQRAYIDFDISPILAYNISKVVFARKRDSFWSKSGGAITVNIFAFTSNDPAKPSIAGNAAHYMDNIKTSGSISIQDSTASGAEIRTDITSIFKPQNAVSGIMGVGFYRTNSGDCSISESDVWLEITYTNNLALPPTNIGPTTQQNPKLPIRISWQHNPAETLIPDPQTGWQLEISQSGTSTISINGDDTLNEYLLPAGSLKNYNNATIRVRTKTQYNGYGAWASKTMTLGQTPPLPPTLIFPTNGITVPFSETIAFEWLFNTTIDVKQGGFEMDIIRDGEPFAVISAEGESQRLEITTDNYIHNFEWRLRTWNELGDIGGWSGRATFNTGGKPQIPAILSVSNQNMPLIRWGMYGGLNWQLLIEQAEKIIFDTGVKPETLANEYRLPVFLPDGSYTAKLRSVSDLNVSSEDGIFNFTLNTEKPEPVKPIVMQNNKYAVHIRFNGAEGEKIILRDGLEIGRTLDVYYNDYTSLIGRKHVYTVRTAKDYNYADSRPFYGIVDFTGTFIAPLDSPEDFIILDRQIDGQPGKNKSIAAGKRAFQVIGREYKLVEFNGFRDIGVDLSYFIVKNKEKDALKLEEWAHMPRLYIVRHKEYGVIKGYFDNFSVDYADRQGTAISMKISQAVIL